MPLRGLAASSSLIPVGGPLAGTGHISGTLGTLPPTARQEHALGPWPRVRPISARLGWTLMSLLSHNQAMLRVLLETAVLSTISG